MLLFMMKSKLHRATVTGANLNYVGSVTIDRELMDAVGIVENERVQIVNNNNGARLETYVIAGEPGSRAICLNGAAARLVQPGDRVIVIAYAMLSEDEARTHRPKVALLDEKNRVVEMMDERPNMVR
ncbi:MAG TPA: aspartate 1-decarboxylase [Myxococcales bacterium]|mgnify:FL=1|jgi:aspartate 1-decarboxylase|nr:aspartate 1-decarboxylase [Myxococcales bacterium]